MASFPPDEIIPAQGTSSDSMSGAIRTEDGPKLKGHQRLLNRLQRMTSTPSLEQIGRSRSSSTGLRRVGKGTMSCISLSSTLSHGQCWESSSSPQIYGKSPHDRHDEDTGPIRIVETELLPPNGSKQATIALPAEMRPCSRGSLLKSTDILVKADAALDESVLSEALPENQNKNYWDTLPVEVQLRILSCLMPKELARAARVSKTWHTLCFDGQLWTKFDTSTFYSSISREALVGLIFSAGPFIKYLNMRGCIQMEKAWLEHGEQLADACRNLASINLEDCHIDNMTLTFLLVRNPGLVRISMGAHSTISNSELNVISKSCPLLEYLDLSWCRNLISAKGLKRVVRSCHQLKELRIGEFRAVDNEFMQALFETNTLETLILSHCSALTDDSLKILSHGSDPKIDILTGRPIVPARTLKHLDLSRCRGISDVGIGHLAGFTPELESLQLSFCSSLGNDSITNLIRTTPRLARLDIEELEELTNNVLIALSKAPCASRLEHLNISYCEKLGDTGMMQVLKNCPNLRSLDLDNTRVSDITLMEMCTQMRKRGFGVKLPKCGLRVAVFDCGNVTWGGVREVLSNNTFVPRFAEAEALATKPEEESESGLSSPSSSTSSVTILPPPPPPPETTQFTADLYPNEIIQLKCFYGWQQTVDRHTKRVLDGNLGAAMRLERKWANCMIANEEAEAGGAGARRRRRRARDAEMLYNLDDDDDAEYGYGPAGLASLGNRRRRARSGGCVVM
ncbi:predicted protein [Uncinocarpus reesii 1704]|uniref:F-box domain-containing protein n=1 Tax=Uncinocarpus reesii (strain UAMH 1704) TaxID=336963 RepID=C4JK43_UNCRE|nr:uncharacterized protein UREG_02000 [Uncinocarpus reesii 1704]EEP77151.1 predicted protein [Uncinocarpus reesii 1704]